MDKLTFYALSSPEKLDRIGEYLAARLSRDVDKRRTMYVQSGIFFCVSGADIQPHSQWNLGDLVPILKKNPNLLFFQDWDFHSVNTHTSYRAI